MAKVSMYKTIEAETLKAFEKKVPYGKRTKVLEELMLEYVNDD